MRTAQRARPEPLRPSPKDLPIAGRPVDLSVVVRRFWCDAVLCGRRIFNEQFGQVVLARYGRRNERLETIVHHLGLALGGRPAAAFALGLMPVSNDTLLRVVRRRKVARNDKLRVIGIDDFAFRRGQTYGTIVCDLERRRPVTSVARQSTGDIEGLALRASVNIRRGPRSRRRLWRSHCKGIAARRPDC